MPPFQRVPARPVEYQSPLAVIVTSLVLLAITAPVQAGGDDSLPVITLEAKPAGNDQPERRLGWRCDSLLRADFSRHSERSCRRNGQESVGRELQTRVVPED